MDGGCSRIAAKEEQLKKKRFQRHPADKGGFNFWRMLQNHCNLQEIIEK